MKGVSCRRASLLHTMSIHLLLLLLWPQWPRQSWRRRCSSCRRPALCCSHLAPVHLLSRPHNSRLQRIQLHRLLRTAANSSEIPAIVLVLPRPSFYSPVGFYSGARDVDGGCEGFVRRRGLSVGEAVGGGRRARGRQRRKQWPRERSTGKPPALRCVRPMAGRGEEGSSWSQCHGIDGHRSSTKASRRRMQYAINGGGVESFDATRASGKCF